MKLCPCCESKVFGNQQHITPKCELENNIKDIDRLDKLLNKYFYVTGEVDDTGKIRPCICCFYRDMKHYFDIESRKEVIHRRFW